VFRLNRARVDRIAAIWRGATSRDTKEYGLAGGAGRAMQAKDYALGLVRHQAADHYFDHARQGGVRSGADHLGGPVGGEVAPVRLRENAYSLKLDQSYSPALVFSAEVVVRTIYFGPGKTIVREREPIKRRIIQQCRLKCG
jgi:hypothetical protein